MEINNKNVENGKAHEAQGFEERLKRFKEMEHSNKYASTSLINTMWEFCSRQKSYLKQLGQFIKDFSYLIQEITENERREHAFLNTAQKILEKEQELYQDIEKYISIENFNEFLTCFTKYEGLFDLYQKESFFRKDATIREYWHCGKLEKDTFYITKNHVNVLNELFPKLKLNCHEMRVPCPQELDRLGQILKKVTEDVETQYAIGEIGDKILLEQQGDIIYTGRFLVTQGNSLPFQGIIFVFEKALVVTKYSLIDKEYVYVGHVLLKLVKLCDLVDNRLEISRGQNGKTIETYVFMQAGKIDGRLSELMERIKQQTGFNETIPLEDLGSVVYSSRFLVKYEDSLPIRGLVLIFDKGLVFTKETDITSKTLGCTYYSHILIKDLVYHKVDSNQFKVQRFRNEKVQDTHIVMHADIDDGDLETFINKLTSQYEFVYRNS